MTNVTISTFHASLALSTENNVRKIICLRHSKLIRIIEQRQNSAENQTEFFFRFIYRHFLPFHLLESQKWNAKLLGIKLNYIENLSFSQRCYTISMENFFTFSDLLFCEIQNVRLHEVSFSSFFPFIDLYFFRLK